MLRGLTDLRDEFLRVQAGVDPVRAAELPGALFTLLARLDELSRRAQTVFRNADRSRKEAEEYAVWQTKQVRGLRGSAGRGRGSAREAGPGSHPVQPLAARGTPPHRPMQGPRAARGR